MSYAWDSSLETGNAQIDNQHKQLVAALNNLLDACRNGKGTDEVADTMEFLAGYTADHFADEEKIQEIHNYPDYLNHRRIHENFKRIVADMAGRLDREGPTEELLADVYANVGDWLVNHIKGDDFKLAVYVRSRTA
jgi:hemerythrin